jgi:salicylate 5-hydroxylase small subunit
VIDVQTYLEVIALHSEYAMVVDSNEWAQWPEFFVEDASYRLQPRENYERGMPLCLLALESKAMMKDRVYAVKETLYHDPYYQRHIVGTPRLLSVDSTSSGRRIVAEANYCVVRTKLDGDSTVFNAGLYHDVIVSTTAGLKFHSRLCVYDSEMIPNSMIYPI